MTNEEKEILFLLTGVWASLILAFAAGFVISESIMRSTQCFGG